MMIGKGIENINAHMPKDAYDTGKYTPTFNAYLTIIVRDSKGNVIKVHRQRSHSPTANFIGLMLPAQYFINTNNSFTLYDTVDSPLGFKQATSNSDYGISYPNSANNHPTYLSGIAVGNGKQSSPFNAINLASQIGNGSASGQLLYGAMSFSQNITASGNSSYFTISRIFANQSGGTVTITEVGIFINISFAQPSGNNYTNFGTILTWYDALSSSISVPNGGSVTIYYTFTINP